jgi:peptidoglycan/LPS O-acetylase OafA/YrhL
LTDGIDSKTLRPILAEIGLIWFLRVVAIYCLLAGVLYWIRLIGFYPGDDWRFDTMPLYWRIAAPSLAVLFPFAGIGLWMTASWGAVVWFLCALSEFVMYYKYSHLFGWNPAVIAVHVTVIVVYTVFRLVIFFNKRNTSD